MVATQEEKERLGRQLAAGEWRQRLTAVAELGRGEAEGSLAMLAQALADPYWQVREQAVQILGKNDSRAAAEALEKALGDRVLAVRRAALAALAGLRGSYAVRPLLLATRDRTDLLAQAAVRSLEARIAGRGLLALPELLPHLAGPYGKIDYLRTTLAGMRKTARDSRRLEKMQVYCAACLRRFQPYAVRWGLLHRTGFFCCHRCGRIDLRLEGVATAVAVFDQGWATPTCREGDTLYVNVMMRERKNRVVDFERLEIRAMPGVDLNEELKAFLLDCFNDGVMHRNALKSVPARLVNRPLLNQNSLNLLKVHLKGYEGEPTLQR